MSDSYQAVYDAVRSQIGRCDVSSVLTDVAREAFDISWQKAHLQEQIGAIGNELQRPCVLFRPVLSVDGNQWCALYSANLQDGVAGFGDTPAAAMTDFDKNWYGQKARQS